MTTTRTAAPTVMATLTPFHFAHLTAIWELDRRIPSPASRAAWAAGRGLDAAKVHKWWYRCRGRAKKLGIEIPEGSYEISTPAHKGLEALIYSRIFGVCTGVRFDQADRPLSMMTVNALPPVLVVKLRRPPRTRPAPVQPLSERRTLLQDNIQAVSASTPKATGR
ncbi:hypothetical protein DFP72DRAFT_182635 [Ephemerocybe angulata]|uniref:Uncharacterized protein n=1 Tax=Ephemerocybe angulata TaxID=980116 RepID=A0A8H6H8F0_9AGAR|nr:hypothetical protein DFP72DRAFT_182635 [Tulosesus angulatus]